MVHEIYAVSLSGAGDDNSCIASAVTLTNGLHISTSSTLLGTKDTRKF
jgi:hypothetical protein